MSTRATSEDAPAAHGVLSSTASRRGFLLVVLAALCWGTSGLSGAIVAERTDLGPLDIAWHRMAIGSVVLLAGYLLGGADAPVRPLR
ncbi:DMT family transporter [Blastococcus sp. PRF04-17]|uniref:DMT family transporter n=1 Tax=Blastococcus sp. PRF04-17 TaxID=2933797 RepID=UPI001FF4F25A|nr:DMT family transporter [Blastococcus sp. PRF04-17]UOY00136.1 DMT family transporter [Blastococcus sp. PRF04-17]